MMEISFHTSPKTWLARHMSQWGILECITASILRYHPGAIVEIGMGASSVILAKYAQQYKVILYSCDIEMGGMWKAFSEPLFKGHDCYIGRSENFIKQFEDKPAIVFIDGQHDYNVVKMETDFFLDKMISGGVLMMHDTWPPLERHLEADPKAHDVYKVRQNLERDPNLDVFTWPYSALSMGLTMVMKHEQNSARKYWQRNGRISAKDS